jgi:predicted TIM-barrel fold metal-dependent hydrolase
MTTVATRVIDSDGHIFEDADAISAHMPSPYRERGPFSINSLFPPLDHHHASHLMTAPPNSFRRVATEGWKEFLSDVGITATVLYPTSALSIGRIPTIDWAVAVSRAYNDWLHEVYLQNDPCFQGVGLLPLQDPKEAVIELRRIVEELGMVGAVLPANGLHSHLGAREFWPVYAEAERLGCALAVHGGCYGGLGMDHLYPYSAVHSLGQPLGQIISLSSIVFNGIFDRFPGVRIAFLEGGVGWLLMCIERFQSSYESHLAYDPGGEFIQLQPGERVSDYVMRQMREGRMYVGIEGSEPDLAYAIRKIGGSEPFMFSSDFPHEVNNEIVKEEMEEILGSDEIAEEDKQATMHGNAQRLYRINGL